MVHHDTVTSNPKQNKSHPTFIWLDNLMSLIWVIGTKCIWKPIWFALIMLHRGWAHKSMISYCSSVSLLYMHMQMNEILSNKHFTISTIGQSPWLRRNARDRSPLGRGFNGALVHDGAGFIHPLRHIGGFPARFNTTRYKSGLKRSIPFFSSTLIARFMGPTGPRWAPCWPHEVCYLGYEIAVD